MSLCQLCEERADYEILQTIILDDDGEPMDLCAGCRKAIETGGTP